MVCYVICVSYGVLGSAKRFWYGKSPNADSRWVRKRMDAKRFKTLEEATRAIHIGIASIPDIKPEYVMILQEQE